jgi:hypothetical protein
VLKPTGTLFTLSPKIQPGRLTLDDTPLKIEEQQTYLGVTFDKRMTWKQLRLGEYLKQFAFCSFL